MRNLIENARCRECEVVECYEYPVCRVRYRQRELGKTTIAEIPVSQLLLPQV